MVEQRTENSCVAGSSPAYGTNLYPCRSTDRIPCYERGDGGSIPSRGTKFRIATANLKFHCK